MRTYGQDRPGPYLTGRPKPPGFFGAGSTAKSTRDITSLKPNVVPGRSTTPASTVAPGASALQHAGGVIMNQFNVNVWRGVNQEQNNRASFYKATDLVNEAYGSTPISGSLKAGLVNFITDGSLPELDPDDMKSSLMQRKSIMDMAIPIMKKEEIDIQPETQKKYESTVKDLKTYDVTK